MSFVDDATLEHLRRAVETPDLSGTRYELRRPLGRGGMGSVYAVLDRELQREVALKVLDLEPSDALIDEARVVARLEHPGIVPVHDVGRLADGRLYCTMKLVRGERLDRWAAGPRSLAERVAVVQRLCEAVAFAHAQGVIHRDLKPANVMVGPFGEVQLMDWGVAWRRDEPGEPLRAVGTEGFMAPEQAAGAPRPDERWDVHALGAILRQLLAAGPRAAPGRPASAALDAIVARACSADPAARYAGPLELSAELSRHAAGERVLAAPEGPVERAWRLGRKYRTPLLLVAAYLAVRVVLLLAGGA
jgi:eukaryotic-like serine/threonine-protein kinase